MSTNDTYLAVYIGDGTGAGRKAWLALPEAERQAKEREGVAAWGAGMEKHRNAIVVAGGALGKTKKISESGIAEESNDRTGRGGVRGGSAAGVIRRSRVRWAARWGGVAAGVPQAGWVSSGVLAEN